MSAKFKKLPTPKYRKNKKKTRAILTKNPLLVLPNKSEKVKIPANKSVPKNSSSEPFWPGSTSNIVNIRVSHKKTVITTDGRKLFLFLISSNRLFRKWFILDDTMNI